MKQGAITSTANSSIWQAQFRADVAARAVRMVFEAYYVMYVQCLFQCIALHEHQTSLSCPLPHLASV